MAGTQRTSSCASTRRGPRRSSRSLPPVSGLALHWGSAGQRHRATLAAEHVADAVHVLDACVAHPGVPQAVAQRRDVRLDQVTVVTILVAPDVLQQLLAADHAAGVRKQVAQQVELNRRHAYDAAVGVDLVTRYVHAQPARAQLSGGQRVPVVVDGTQHQDGAPKMVDRQGRAARGDYYLAVAVRSYPQFGAANGPVQGHDPFAEAGAWPAVAG